MTKRRFRKGDRVEWSASTRTKVQGTVLGHVNADIVSVLWDDGEKNGAPVTSGRLKLVVVDDEPTMPDHLSDTLNPSRRK
jgi:hypothetical protein